MQRPRRRSGIGANTMRTVRERYRAAYSEALGHWQSLRDELEAAERAPRDARPRVVDATFDDDAVAAAAEAGAADARLRALRGEVEALGSELGAHRSKLAELELAEQSLERTWLFLGQGDGSLVEGDHPADDDNMAMRIIQAQEAERARIAQEIHDGSAQALANAIFQADFIERVGASDPAAGADEVRTLREMLRRELANVRDSINQLRPPLLDELGLGARSRMPSSACGP